MVLRDSNGVVAAVIASGTVLSINTEAVETAESSVETLTLDATSKVSTTVEVEKFSTLDSVFSEKARVVDSTALDVKVIVASVTCDSVEDSSVELITSVDVFSSSTSDFPVLSVVPNSKSASVDFVLEGVSDGLAVESSVDDEVELTLMYFVSTENVVENGIVEDISSSKYVKITPEDVVSSAERLMEFSVVVS